MYLLCVLFFPSSGDKLLREGKAAQLSHYELFLIALNLLAVKMRQRLPNTHKKSRPSREKTTESIKKEKEKIVK